MATVALTYTALPSGPVKMAMTAIIVSALVISVTNSGVFYTKQITEKGKPVWSLKNFGTGHDETIFPAWLAMASAGYLVYMISMTTSLINISK